MANILSTYDPVYHNKYYYHMKEIRQILFNQGIYIENPIISDTLYERLLQFGDTGKLIYIQEFLNTIELYLYEISKSSLISQRSTASMLCSSNNISNKQLYKMVEHITELEIIDEIASTRIDLLMRFMLHLRKVMFADKRGLIAKLEIKVNNYISGCLSEEELEKAILQIKSELYSLAVESQKTVHINLDLYIKNVHELIASIEAEFILDC